MLQVLWSVYSLLISVGFLMLSIGMFNTFIGLRSTLEGFTESTIGLMMSAYYAGLVFGTLYCGRLINRIGHIRAFTAFCAANAAATLIFPFAVSAPVWILLRGIIGFNLAGLYMVTESWLNTRASAETRGTLLSLYMMTCFLGTGSGNFLINLGDTGGFALFTLAAMLFSLAVIPVAITRATHPDPVDSAHFGFRRLYAISPVAVAGCLAAGLATGALFGMGPVFSQNIGLTIGQTSIFMGAAVMSGLFLQWPIGNLSDRYDRRSVIIGVSLASGLASLGMVLAVASFDGDASVWLNHAAILLALVAIYGSLSSTIYSLSIAYANDYIEPADMVQASGGLVLAFGIGAAIGPTTCAFLMKLIGPGGLFVYCGAIPLLLAAFAVYRSRRRSWAPVMEKEAFVALPQSITMPSVTDLDPRAEGTQLALDFGDEEGE